MSYPFSANSVEYFGGGWVYVQALRSVTRGWGGGLRQRYITSFF